MNEVKRRARKNMLDTTQRREKRAADDKNNR
jgi:hypothetical protein